MTHMQKNINLEVLRRVTYLIGSEDLIAKLPNVPAIVPFHDTIIEFLNQVSRVLMGNRAVRAYPDLVTFAFWIRKSSVLKQKERFENNEEAVTLGRGVAFHIAPSNEPVNFAYSLAAGLLCGNANIVRVPSKEFAQVHLLAEAFYQALEQYEELRSYVLLVRYGREKAVNDLFSSIADVRIVWGGDRTIEELRKSPLPPRSGEITFADRYSVAVIDADSYLRIEDKARTAEDFYNDTFLTDQNACTSPRVIVWMGHEIEEAKEMFWEEAYRVVRKKYNFQAIQGVNKLTSGYRIAAAESGVKIRRYMDNQIIRVSIPRITDFLMDYRDNSGYFYEYNCDHILEIRALCDDKRCQTIAYIGQREAVQPLLQAGVKGIDRVVPVGKTMDFDLIWDGYCLPSLLTRTIHLI